MGASRYMAVEPFTDEHDRDYKAGDFVTGAQYERMGDPSAFRPADYPSEVDQLREEYGLTDADAEPEQPRAAAIQDEDLDAMTVEDLRALAADRDIEGRSAMNKQQLVDALRAQ